MTSFILSFADKTPGDEIIRQARAKGMSISLPYIYATRSKARRHQVGAGASVRPASRNDSQDAHLAAMVRIVLDLGLAGTRDLLSTVESRLTSAAVKGT